MMRYAVQAETLATLRHRATLDEASAAAVAVPPAAQTATQPVVPPTPAPAAPTAPAPPEPTKEPTCISELPADSTCKYDVFVSHSKRTEASEDRAIWVADVADGHSLRVFFDRSDLTEITREQLRKDVHCSRVMVTILDPYTFSSEWVCAEYEWAIEANRPVVGMYDGDRFRWEQIAAWKDDFPYVFRRPIINYQKDYRVESKRRLLGAIEAAALTAASCPLRRNP